MDYQWHDFIGNLGVAMIVIAYYLLQTERTTSRAAAYFSANAVRACLVQQNKF
jgi:hypothetical protein